MPIRLSTLIRLVLACLLGVGVLTLRLPGGARHQAWARVTSGGDDDDSGGGDESGDSDRDSDRHRDSDTDSDSDSDTDSDSDSDTDSDSDSDTDSDSDRHRDSDRDRDGDSRDRDRDRDRDRYDDSRDSDDDSDDDDDSGDGSGMDKDQPPVTAGGLYTKKTFPTALTLRPLTLIKGMFEVLGGFNMDMSAADAFETWRVPIEARYGLADHVELQSGADFLLLSNQARRDTTDDAIINLGLEGALYYNLVDIRVAADIGINQNPPPVAAGTDSQSYNEPFWMDLVMGLPFRWAPRKQFAIVGLDKIFTVHLRGAKPDLTADLGVIIQPLDFVALLLQAELTVPQFNTNTLLVPASATLQFSPSNALDLGLKFTFKNVKPPDGAMAPDGSALGPFDERFLLVYLQTRL